jgi:hypothetical protein
VTLETYLATHKKLSDELGAAGKAFDDARNAEINAITSGEDHGKIEDLHKKTRAAELERDGVRKGIALLEKENPALDDARHTDEKRQRFENVANATLEVGSVTKDVAEAAIRVAAGLPPEPPSTGPETNIDVIIPPGGIWNNVVIGTALLVDQAKGVVQDAGDTLANARDAAANAIAAGKELPGKVLNAAVGALPEEVRVALGGESVAALEAKSKPSDIQPDAAKELDASGAARQPLSQYKSDLHMGIASGSSYVEAEKIASEKLHQNLTGEAYEKPGGLHNAVRNELEKQYGEPAKKIYEDSIAANLEQERQRVAGLEGWAR